MFEELRGDGPAAVVRRRPRRIRGGRAHTRVALVPAKRVDDSDAGTRRCVVVVSVSGCFGELFGDGGGGFARGPGESPQHAGLPAPGQCRDELARVCRDLCVLAVRLHRGGGVSGYSVRRENQSGVASFIRRQGCERWQRCDDGVWIRLGHVRARARDQEHVAAQLSRRFQFLDQSVRAVSGRRPESLRGGFRVDSHPPLLLEPRLRGVVRAPRDAREPREPLFQLHHLASQPRVIGDDLTFFLQSPLFAVADEAHPRGRVGVAYVRAARRRFLHDGRLRLGAHRGRCPVPVHIPRVAVVFVGMALLAGPRSSHERLDVSQRSFHLISEPVRFVHDPRVRRGRAFSLCLGVAFVAFVERSLGGGELDLEALHLR